LSLNVEFLAKQMELITQTAEPAARAVLSWPRYSSYDRGRVGLGAMQTILEYEKNAADCRHTAAQMKDPQLKKQLEDMAEVWERLASERRQGIVENGPDKAQHQTGK
jgi:hypothetical protein